MIDFHSHILPNVDDGAESYEESIKLLHEAKSVGFEKIISTSHYAFEYYEVPEYKRKELLEELKSEKNIPELYLGSEIFMTYNIINLLEEYSASTINGTNYILVEIPLKHHFSNLKDVIYRLQDKNYKVILAHPERYLLVQKNYEIIRELSSIGVLFQANYGSILGIYGYPAKKTVKRLLQDGYINFLGSDVHKPNSIYSKIPLAIKRISRIIDDEKLDQLTTLNAEKILNGETL